jgi:hypothetical protein
MASLEKHLAEPKPFYTRKEELGFSRLLTAPPDGCGCMDVVALLCMLFARVQDEVDANIVLHLGVNRVRVAVSEPTLCALAAA